MEDMTWKSRGEKLVSSGENTWGLQIIGVNVYISIWCLQVQRSTAMETLEIDQWTDCHFLSQCTEDTNLTFSFLEIQLYLFILLLNHT